MSIAGDDLRATSEAIAADADRLRRIEEEKQALPEGHPDVVGLSERAEQITRDLVPKAAAERELAAEIDGERGDDA